MSILFIILNFLFCDNHKKTLVVYYEDTLDISLFSDFKSYEIVSRKVKFNSMIATKIAKPTKAENYTFYLINTPLLHDCHGVKNYSIKGLTFLDKRNSVVTTYRTSRTTIKKILKHEFAHGYNLPHCTHKNCIMNDAKGKIKNLNKCNTFKESCALKINHLL